MSILFSCSTMNDLTLLVAERTQHLGLCRTRSRDSLLLLKGKKPATLARGRGSSVLSPALPSCRKTPGGIAQDPRTCSLAKMLRHH